MIPRPLAPLLRRRIHLLDPRTALNLVTAHESRRRRGSKRPPPSHRAPPRPGPPRPPRWKGPPKRKGHGQRRDKPWTQATRGSSPAETRVKYRTKPPRKSKTSKSKSKSKGKPRPPVPSYADGYAEDEDLRDRPEHFEDPETEEDRPRKRPSKKPTAKYPKGWGPDGGYRVPAPPASTSPRYPPYGTEEEEPGTGHLDLEERFINQHNQFYRHGYPADSSEAQTPSSTKHKGYFEDEEIEVAEGDDFAPDGLTASSSSQRQPPYRRPSTKTRYSSDASTEEDDYRRPYSSHSSSTISITKGRKKKPDRDRHQSMYHAKFRDQQDDRTLSAANFNYELSGAASETAHATVNKNKNNNQHHDSNNNSNNHRPSYDTEPNADFSDPNFFRTRKPQYWG